MFVVPYLNLAMSLVLTRNAALRRRWGDLQRIDPESGTQWEKFYLPKTDRDPKLYGWYHNSPYHGWNNKAFYAFDKFPVRESVIARVLNEKRLSRFAELLTFSQSSVLHELSTPGPWTLFAPVNSAFDRIRGGWESFRDEAHENPTRLHSFLRRHAGIGSHKLRFCATRQNRVASVAGVLYNVRVSGSFEKNDRCIRVNLADSSLSAAEVIDYDIRTSNGYVHVVDSVLGYSLIDKRENIH